MKTDRCNFFSSTKNSRIQFCAKFIFKYPQHQRVTGDTPPPVRTDIQMFYLILLRSNWQILIYPLWWQTVALRIRCLLALTDCLSWHHPVFESQRVLYVIVYKSTNQKRLFEIEEMFSRYYLWPVNIKQILTSPHFSDELIFTIIDYSSI